LNLNFSIREKIHHLTAQWADYSGHEGFQLFTLENEFVFVTITNFGLRFVHLLTPDSKREPVDIIVGPETPDDFFASNNPYYGAIIGRFANRIDQGRFQINGQWHELACNNGAHHLHGGEHGLHNQKWNCIYQSNSKLKFSHHSPHLTENYPGNLNIEVSIELDQNRLKLGYRASTDAPTILNLTHHPFFNLDGCGTANFDSHLLQLEADYYLPVRTDMIPEGSLSEIKATPFDFTKPSSLAEHLKQKHEQIERGNGFDHCFVLRDYLSQGYGFIASVFSMHNGIFMRIYTTEPGMQLYTGNFMDGSNKMKNGGYDTVRSAFCLETQHFPDSPNQPHFPSVSIVPGQEYQSTTSFEFLTNQ
jgi:aldose 1-epimerase